MRSCSQTRPEICSQTRPGINLCSLSGLSLQSRGQFLVLLNQSEQDRDPLSTFALDCLCQTGFTPWSVSLLFHGTILLFLYFLYNHVPWSCWGHNRPSLSPWQKQVSASPVGNQRFLMEYLFVSKIQLVYKRHLDSHQGFYRVTALKKHYKT